MKTTTKAAPKALNAIHYGAKKHLETKMESWSNDVYEEVPFSCDPKLSEEKLNERLGNAIYKKFKPSHHAGCGYSCYIHEVKRTAPDKGTIVLKHYHGIGD